jgi:ubiquinol-cytochrome c reductase cytochrome c1 subunit
MNFPKRLLAILALLPGLALANEGGVALDKAPDRSNNMAALQHGAKLFVNYCLNCHNASSMRYKQIKANLLFTGDKVGEMMTTTMKPADAKAWFGVVPPDLSVIQRAKASGAGSGSDYLYTYLRTFYQDNTRPTGWNNLVVNNVAMPHVLWELQGVQKVVMKEVPDPHEHGKMIHQFAGFEQVTPGKLQKLEFDTAVADLVGYMEWMAEPAAQTRKKLGAVVVLFMALFAFLAWRLNASFWKEVK